jgi:hypothetical protein
LEPLDPQVDHVRGGPGGRLILGYGDYECPYSRRAFREVERVESQVGDAMRFAFRHFPLTDRADVTRLDDLTWSAPISQATAGVVCGQRPTTTRSAAKPVYSLAGCATSWRPRSRRS